jgi:hypothetical protein
MGVPISVPRRGNQGEWFRVATRTSGRSALREIAELDHNLALAGAAGNRMLAAGNLFLWNASYSAAGG